MPYLFQAKRRRNYAAKSKVSSKSDEESDSEPDSEPDEHEDGDFETKEKEEHIISQTSSGRIARKRTFFNYDELLTPSKVPRKTDVKFEDVSISKRPSPTTRKQEIESSQKSPERNQTGKHVHFAAKVSICTYDDDWDSSSDDVSPDEVEGLEMYRPDQEKYHCHKEAKKAVRFDPIVTVFPIPPRDANRSFEINNNDASCSDINLSQQPKKSVRFSENVSIHSYENFSDSSSDSGVDDFDEHFNSLDDFDEIIDRELNRLQVRDGEKEQDTLKLAEPAYDAFDMMSPKEFIKIFDNMSKTFNLQSINATQLNLPEAIVLLEQDDQKTLTNIFDDFLNALKMVPDGEQKVSPNVNVTTRNEIFLVLRAIMVTLNSPSLEPMNLKLSKIMDEFQGSDPIVPVETLRAALKSLLQTVQAVCIAKPV
ncbi:hypothetical protein CAEBREN_18822 [Caenorhabditis brenneri]|uniref:Uncharacterized protein n=1 Tax=Caenorhabditis brenneri TaxID=135651 RepID=G0MRD1_CAEBE|nr:hypothetical protein CAEBREN_18822 [Caenorhabditis brenneri]